jgi:hypothetical protein
VRETLVWRRILISFLFVANVLYSFSLLTRLYYGWISYSLIHDKNNGISHNEINGKEDSVAMIVWRTNKVEVLSLLINWLIFCSLEELGPVTIRVHSFVVTRP